ncbi:hypothetical protein ACWEPN_40960 [Nonomuraea wenchangensis]
MLPGVGPKSAQRIAFHSADVKRLRTRRTGSFVRRRVGSSPTRRRSWPRWRSSVSRVRTLTASHRRPTIRWLSAGPAWPRSTLSWPSPATTRSGLA